MDECDPLPDPKRDRLQKKIIKTMKDLGLDITIKFGGGPCGAAVERWTGNREVPGSNLDRCTVICPTTRYEVSFIYRLIVAVAKSCVT